ncbi:MAG: hypothetical protein ACLSB9_23850 [Hydrogeniiclostridium mannosilyticum]
MAENAGKTIAFYRHFSTALSAPLLVQPILHKLFLFQILLNKGGKVVVKFSFKIRADSMIERFFIHLA